MVSGTFCHRFKGLFSRMYWAVAVKRWRVKWVVVFFAHNDVIYMYLVTEFVQTLLATCTHGFFCLCLVGKTRTELT